MRQDKQHIQNFKTLFTQAFKNEWKAISSDRTVVSVFVSMGLLLLVGYSLIYGEEVVHDVPIAIIDQDNSRSSREFINMVELNQSAKIIRGFTTLEDAKPDFYANKVYGLLVVPKNFEKDLLTNRQTIVSIYSDASNFVLYRAVQGAVVTAQGYYNGGIKVKRAIASGDSVAAVSPISLISTSLFNPSAGYGIYLVPTIASLALQLIILLAIGILGGDSNIKWITAIEQHVIKPGGSMPILFGRACLYLVIFLVIFPIQYGLIFSYFSFPMRASLGAVYIFNLPYIISLVFLGIFISTFFKRSEDAILFLSVLVIPSLVLTGLTYPYEGFVLSYKYLSELLPSTSGTRGMIKLTQMGASFEEIKLEWAKLWVLSLFYFILTVLRIRFKARKYGSSKKFRNPESSTIVK
ncbi:ABC transporter permease [Ulvibacterium sp.]|uniref:ABC transporter permease n=1 Tax=Ulvibacterium sp. TaxID=2665914 RepID=UPI002634D3A7|nr:ABC transporter permease [Ulvibacterium sp.]